MFKLHDFEYNYHYDLAGNAMQNDAENNTNNCNTDNNENENEFEAKSGTNGHAQRLSARMDKREMSENEEEEKKTKHAHAQKRKKSSSKKKRSKSKEGKHYYLNSDALDAHYEKKHNQNIPKSFAASTRLTKTELVEIVSQHFLSQPLLAELNEIDVIKQFLLFIQNRRKRLKKEFCLE